MSLPVALRPEAEQDLIEARNWHERQQRGFGEDFLESISTIFERLAETPELNGITRKNVRTCRPKKFPYVIYYRVMADRVEVLAILHGSRDPSVWRSRV
jgi:plasmid stabilization system protein ParE